MLVPARHRQRVRHCEAVGDGATRPPSLAARPEALAGGSRHEARVKEACAEPVRPFDKPVLSEPFTLRQAQGER